MKTIDTISTATLRELERKYEHPKTIEEALMKRAIEIELPNRYPATRIDPEEIERQARQQEEEYSSLQSEVDDLNEQIETLDKENDDLQEQVNSKQSVIEDLEKELRDTQQQLEQALAK